LDIINVIAVTKLNLIERILQRLHDYITSTNMGTGAATCHSITTGSQCIFGVINAGMEANPVARLRWYKTPQGLIVYPALVSERLCCGSILVCDN
jgi:hypothetical protein